MYLLFKIQDDGVMPRFAPLAFLVRLGQCASQGALGALYLAELESEILRIMPGVVCHPYQVLLLRQKLSMSLLGGSLQLLQLSNPTLGRLGLLLRGAHAALCLGNLLLSAVPALLLFVALPRQALPQRLHVVSQPPNVLICLVPLFPSGALHLIDTPHTTGVRTQFHLGRSNPD
jgi:hypothetical protein